MNRWMTRFAFGAKCGFLGASGLTVPVGDANAPVDATSLRSEARAILPTPTPAFPEEVPAGDVASSDVSDLDSWVTSS